MSAPEQAPMESSAGLWITGVVGVLVILGWLAVIA